MGFWMYRLAYGVEFVGQPVLVDAELRDAFPSTANRLSCVLWTGPLNQGDSGYPAGGHLLSRVSWSSNEYPNGREKEPESRTSGGPPLCRFGCGLFSDSFFRSAWRCGSAPVDFAHRSLGHDPFSLGFLHKASGLAIEFEYFL